MSISKKVRFEVFKRDKFTCQYCGRSAPDVVLECDHIHPVAKGGEDDILNFVTSCHDCNAGKSDRLLSDDAVIQKRKAQLDELQDRREQIEMMMEWQAELSNTDDIAIGKLGEMWGDLLPGHEVTTYGMATLRKWYLKYGLVELMEAMRTSVNQYVQYNKDGTPTRESTAKAFDKIEGICRVRETGRKDPDLNERWYVLNILKKRMYADKTEAMDLIRRAHDAGASYPMLRSMAGAAGNWSSWRRAMEDLIKGGS